MFFKHAEKYLVTLILWKWKLSLFIFNLQDISESVVPQWKKSKLREELKTTKKELDDADRAMKAGRMQRVNLYFLDNKSEFDNQSAFDNQKLYNRCGFDNQSR